MSETPVVGETGGETGRNIRHMLAQTGPLWVLLLLIGLLWILSPPFRSPTSLMLLGLEAAAIGLVAAGQTFVILTGGIDLSVEAMVSFAGVVAAILIAGTNVAGGQIAFGIADWQAVLIAITAAMLVGLFQGVIITGLNINPLIVTLGFRSILLGVSLVWTRGAGINIQKGPFLDFVTTTIDIFGMRIPMPFVIALLLYFVSWIVLKHTKFGRYTYAIGGNETAARLSGINVDRVKTFIYGISGLFAGISGILVMGRLQSGAYQNGTNMTLISVAAVVIGGTALIRRYRRNLGHADRRLYHSGRRSRSGLHECAVQRQRNRHRRHYRSGSGDRRDSPRRGEVAEYAKKYAAQDVAA